MNAAEILGYWVFYGCLPLLVITIVYWFVKTRILPPEPHVNDGANPHTLIEQSPREEAMAPQQLTLEQILNLKNPDKRLIREVESYNLEEEPSTPKRIGQKNVFERTLEEQTKDWTFEPNLKLKPMSKYVNVGGKRYEVDGEIVVKPPKKVEKEKPSDEEESIEELLR